LRTVPLAQLSFLATSPAVLEGKRTNEAEEAGAGNVRGPPKGGSLALRYRWAKWVAACRQIGEEMGLPRRPA
jgi:hypothetical protein